MKPVHPTQLASMPARILASLLATLAPAAAGWAQTRGHRPPAQITPAPAAAETTPQLHSSYTLRQLGIDYEITLRGTAGSVGIPFSIRADRLVNQATLHLRYSYSPALLPELSHIKVTINGVTVATLPTPRDGAGQLQSRDIPIDARLITDFNRLDLQLIGHYTRDCEDPDHSSLWANIDSDSSIELSSTALPLSNNLSLLPLPFLDRNDPLTLTLPFVFAGLPDNATTQVAGIVASWFGAQAGYRGASFPVDIGNLPTGTNAVVIATPDRAPPGIDLPPIDGPTLAVVDRPGDPLHKLLLVLGRNAGELRVAASALALGTPLQGATETIRDFKEAAARKPYDAPRWLSSQHPVRFGQLGDPNSFSVNGYHPDLVRVNMQLPPDLFGWQSKGIPIDLKYRYTPPLSPGKSVLSMGVNSTFIGALVLRPAADKRSLFASLLPALASDGTLSYEHRFHAPLSAFAANSQMRFHFFFDRPQADACKSTLDNNDVHGAIDPDSTIDISGFPHFMAMPDLAAFANAGFPFTRMADLSQTAIVLPDAPGASDISDVLDLLGRMGAATGYPSLRAAIIRAGQVQRYADRDLIVLGSLDNQPLFKRWASALPIGDGATRHYHLSDWLQRTLPWLDSRRRTDLPTVADVGIKPGADDVTVMGFQSPLQNGRSVVAIQARDATSVDDLFRDWRDPKLLGKVQGSVVLVHDDKVRSLAGNQTYYVGHLSWWLRARWLASRHPVLLAAAAVIYALLMAWLLRALLRRRAARRLRGDI